MPLLNKTWDAKVESSYAGKISTKLCCVYSRQSLRVACTWMNIKHRRISTKCMPALQCLVFSSKFTSWCLIQTRTRDARHPRFAGRRVCPKRSHPSSQKSLEVLLEVATLAMDLLPLPGWHKALSHCLWYEVNCVKWCGMRTSLGDISLNSHVFVEQIERCMREKRVIIATRSSPTAPACDDARHPERSVHCSNHSASQFIFTAFQTFQLISQT